jgi:hypothetical protein
MRRAYVSSQTLLDPKKYNDNKIICVDFDGTITDYKDGWISHEEIGENTRPLDGAFAGIRSLVSDYTVVIWSVRGNTEGGRVAMERWLVDQGLELEVVSKLHFLPGKPPAIAFIDDRSIAFQGHWGDMYGWKLVSYVRQFAPWYRFTR